MYNIQKIGLSFVFSFVLIGLFACSSVPVTENTTTATSTVGTTTVATLPSLAKVSDEFAELDDESITDKRDPFVVSKLEASRRKYVRALSFIDRGDTASAATSFQDAVEILNTLAGYPGIEENSEFTDLMESILEDYETYITNINYLDENSAFFILRDKFLQDTTLAPPKPVVQKITTGVVPQQEQGRNLRDITGISGELQIPLETNEFVQMRLNFLQTEKGQKFTRKCLERTGRWFPLMRKILKEEGVPEELLYLSVIESGLNPTIVSSAYAVGLWQFIKTTGAMYDLKQTYWYDERRDPEKATRAGARHLKDLYNELGDWYLAFAAYNYGLGGVRRAIKRSGLEKPTYWQLREILPRETRWYVPKYIAQAIVFMNPEEYGYNDVQLQEEYKYDVYPVSESVDFAVIAKLIGCSPETLDSLNPELIRRATPPDVANYPLKVPVGSAQVLAQQFPQLTDEEKRPWQIHTVQRRETVHSIARKYSSSPDIIAEANDINVNAQLKIGAKLRVPITSAMATTAEIGEGASSATPSPLPPLSTDKAIAGSAITHTIKAGETLFSIARTYGVRVSDIRNWNGISYDSENIVIGDKLTIYNGTQAIAENPATPEVKRVQHKVRRGETLAKIADDYNTTVDRLRSLNKLNKKGSIRANQLLTIEQNSVNRSAVAAEKTPVPTASYAVHKVAPGQTLYQIASLYGVSVADLQRWNPDEIQGNTVFADTRIKVYAENISKGGSAKTAGTPRKTYTVKQGDTLASIARRFGVSVETLQKINRSLRPESLQIGQKVRLQ